MRRHVGVGQRVHAAEMEAAGGRDENAPDEDEKARAPVPVRQVDGHRAVVRGGPGRRAQIAVEKPVQVKFHFFLLFTCAFVCT